jgi:hypothetical protein
VIDREADEEGECPPAADGGTGEDAVVGTALEEKAAAEESEAQCESDGALTGRAEGAKLVAEEEGETDDQRDDAEFVEPVLAETLFERDGGARLRCE